MRVLDEVADAFRTARRHEGRAVRSSVRIPEQFEYPITAPRWARVERHLGCPLPQLGYGQGHWWLPDGLETVWDLAAHVERGRPDWEPPLERTVEAWHEAQIFAGVRAVLMDAGSLDSADVVRSARLGADLGLE